MADANLVSHHSQNGSGLPNANSEQILVPPRNNEVAPTIPEAEAYGDKNLGQLLNVEGLPPDSLQIIQAARRQGTRDKYQGVLEKWAEFCRKRHITSTRTSVNDIILFLTEQYRRGLKYNTISCYRSALNSFITTPESPDISLHPILRSFMKGVFNLRPPQPRYTTVWDANLVIQYFNRLGDNGDLSLKQLTQKLAMLLILLSSTRGNSVHSFVLSKMYLCSTEVTFIPNILLKHHTPNNRIRPMVYKAFDTNKRLCPVDTLSEYLTKRCEMIHTSEQLFFTHATPHRPASRDTISRWVKEVMSSANINTNIFKAHSCRAAAASAAKHRNISIQTIMDAADWKNAKTFAKHYDLTIEFDNSFGTQLLNALL